MSKKEIEQFKYVLTANIVEQLKEVDAPPPNYLVSEKIDELEELNKIANEAAARWWLKYKYALYKKMRLEEIGSTQKPK